MSQTRKGSATEVGVNLLIGYACNFLGNWILLPLFGFNSLTVAKNIEIGLAFTVISIVRQYCLRRLFNSLKIFDKKEATA